MNIKNHDGFALYAKLKKFSLFNMGPNNSVLYIVAMQSGNYEHITKDFCIITDDLTAETYFL